MKKFKLRDYQADDLKRINKEIKAGHKRVLYSLMTAGGKTVVLHEQVSRWLRKGLRGCVLVHTRALLNQTCAVFSDVPHGIIAGGIKSDPDKKLQICMVQSLARRGGKAFDFIVVDEAHHATASTWAKILADSPDAIIFGVTATPFRHDNRGLGQAGFTTLVEGPEVSWLTEQGFLSPVEYYAPTDIDMTGVKKVGGDYEKKESSRRANKPTITGSAVEHYKRHANGQRALVFCADIKHVLSVTKKFKKAGLNAAFIHGKMTTDEREDVLLQFAESKDMILVSCELIGEGLDVPAVGCVILLRPTASLVRFIQQVGRGLRAAEGKKHVVVLDHVGNIHLGHPHVRREIDLNGVEKKAKSLDENSPRSYLRTCPKCKRVETADVLKCSTCGYRFKVAVRGGIFSKEGSLQRIDGWSEDTDPYAIKKVTTVLGKTHYVIRFAGNEIHLGLDLDEAEAVRLKLLPYILEGKLPCGNKRTLLLEKLRFECRKNPFGVSFVKSKRGPWGFFRGCINSTNLYFGTDLHTSNALSDWLMDWYYSNGEIFPRGEEMRLLCQTGLRVVSGFSLKLCRNSNSGFYCCVNGLKIYLGSNVEAIDQFENGLREEHKKRGTLPSGDDLELLVRKIKFYSGFSPATIFKESTGQFKLCVAGTKRRAGTEKTANECLKYLLKFYESNNYEWPPKSEVSALVKKALEHAKSIVE